MPGGCKNLRANFSVSYGKQEQREGPYRNATCAITPTKAGPRASCGDSPILTGGPGRPSGRRRPGPIGPRLPMTIPGARIRRRGPGPALDRSVEPRAQSAGQSRRPTAPPAATAGAWGRTRGPAPPGARKSGGRTPGTGVPAVPRPRPALRRGRHRPGASRCGHPGLSEAGEFPDSSARVGARSPGDAVP